MNLLIREGGERGPLTLTWLLIDRREEGNAVKEGQKCGRRATLARIRSHGGVNGAAWRARRVGQVTSFSPFAQPGDGLLNRAQIGVMPTSRGRAGLDITSLTRHCTGRKSNGINTGIIRNVATITRPLHLGVMGPRYLAGTGDWTGRGQQRPHRVET